MADVCEGVPDPGLAEGVLARALAALPDPVLILSAVRGADGAIVELRYDFMNEAAARLYGLSVEAVLHRGFCELFPSVRELGIFDVYVQVVESGAPVFFGAPPFLESGLEGAFWCTAVRFGDGILVSVHDISGQRRAESVLAEFSRRYQLLAENASDFVVQTTPEGVLTWVSPSVTAVLGWVPQEIVGRSWFDFIDPELVAEVRETIARAAAGEPVFGRTRLRCADGSYLWVSRTWRPIADDSGSVVVLVAGFRDVQAEVDAEQALAESEHRYRLLAENASDFVVQVSPEGVVTWVSPSVTAALGWEPAEVVGQNGLDFVHPDHLTASRAALSRILATGGVVSDRTCLRCADGSYRWVSRTWRPIADDSGAVTALVGGFRDVQSEVEAERALARSEERFRAAFDDAPVGIVIADLTGRWLQVNGAFARITGYAVDRLLQLSAVDLLSPDDMAARGAFVEEVANARGPRAKMNKIRRADGRLVVVDVTAAPLYDEAGTQVGFISHIEDVTERERAHQDIRRMAAILESSNDAIISKTVDGIITTWNPAAERLYGYTAAEAVGMSISFLVPPGQVDDVGELLARVARGKRIEHYETTRICKDGRVMDVSLSVAPIRDSRGALIGASTIARDITDRKRAEESARAAEGRFRTAFERAPVGMARVSVDGRLVEVNDALSDLLGYTNGQMLGRSTIELTHPDDVARTADAIARCASGELTSYQTEKRFLHANGHPVWVALSVVAVTDSGGRVQHLLAHYLDITDRKRLEAHLAHLAEHDPLTGLLNRRAFETELDRQTADVTRYGPSGALVMLDLDHFKEVNDTLGHRTGDELIVSISGVLNRTVRGTDIVARLGGDEFAIILPHAGRTEAQAVADKIVRAVRNQVTVLSGDHRRMVTASVGVAMFDDPCLGGEGVLLNADLALYAAKNAGRNRYSFYDVTSPGQAPAKARLDWVERINVALEHDRFELHAQPVLDLRTGRVSRYELLLRMLDDDDGATIGPNEFLHTAERTGLIGRIDRWVTGQAIDLLAHPDLPADTVLEVNISGLSVGDADLLTFLEERFTQTGADPSRLVFEITETAAIGNVSAARTFAERLTDIGCQFALDDFGAGFGSFYYLKHLLFDYIKIDGEFIANCITSQTDQLVIQALITIAHGLHKQTVAEFVGDEDTLRFVASQGIDFAQGYHIGKPDVIDALIHEPARGPAPDRVRT